VTLEEAAERLQCSTKTVRRKIASRELRASHVARGVWAIREEDLDAYLDAVANRPREVRPLPAAKPVSSPGPRRRAGRGRGDGRLVITDDMGRHAA
jgi:excisionase family DNA binding protein